MVLLFTWSLKRYREALDKCCVHTQMVAVTKYHHQNKNTGECRCLQLTNWSANRVNQK